MLVARALGDGCSPYPRRQMWALVIPSGEGCSGQLLSKLFLCSVLLGSAWSLDNGLALTPVMGKLDSDQPQVFSLERYRRHCTHV